MTLDLDIQKRQTVSTDSPTPPLRKLEPPKVRTEALNAWYGSNHVLKELSIDIREHAITAII